MAANLPIPGRRYTHELFVGDLIALFESGDGPAHVLGYSFAGTVAQIALSRRPELFASLTLLSCPPITANELWRTVWRRTISLMVWRKMRVSSAPSIRTATR